MTGSVRTRTAAECTRGESGMTPEIYLMLGAKPEDVGTAINGFRAAFIKAVLVDSELATIVGSNGDIRYEGCATGLCPRPQHGGRDGSLLHLLLHSAAG